MQERHFIKELNNADFYAIHQRLRKTFNLEFEISMKREKSNEILFMEISDLPSSDDDFYIEFVFDDKCGFIMDCSPELPFDPSTIYDVLIEYFKDRFGPEYIKYIRDTAITC